MAQDDGRALALWVKACDGGEAPACYNLGNRYKQGRGVSKDLGRAVDLHIKACDLGLAEACALFGPTRQPGQRAPE